MYGTWDVLDWGPNRLEVGLIHSFYSGAPYGFSEGIATGPYVTNAPAYKTPPGVETYAFTRPDAYTLPSFQSTDLSLTYGFHVPALGANVELFIEPIVTNVFNRKAVVSNDQLTGNINLTAQTAADGFPGLVPFNPFTDKPKQCTSFSSSGACTTPGANWAAPAGTNGLPSTSPYALAQSTAAYQAPRTYYVSFGIRF